MQPRHARFSHPGCSVSWLGWICQWLSDPPCIVLQGFDEESGHAKQPIEVLSWPYHDLLVKEGFTGAHSRRYKNGIDVYT